MKVVLDVLVTKHTLQEQQPTQPCQNPPRQRLGDTRSRPQDLESCARSPLENTRYRHSQASRPGIALFR